MKLRMGFVSNSSSSSFLGIGWYFDVDGVDDFIQTLINPNYKNGEYDEIKSYLTKFHKDLDYRDGILVLQFDMEHENMDGLQKEMDRWKKELTDNENLKKIVDTYGQPSVIYGDLEWY